MKNLTSYLKKGTGLSLSGFILLLVLWNSSCEKEPDCGCDGKKAFDLNDQLGTIHHDLPSDYAYFISDGMYTEFTLCNTSEFSDTLAKFQQGERVFVTGSAHYECYRNPYALPSYLLKMKSIRIYKIDD